MKAILFMFYFSPPEAFLKGNHCIYIYHVSLHVCAPTWGALCPKCSRAGESSVQLARAVLLGLQVINEKRDWMVWSLSYQFGHQLLEGSAKQRVVRGKWHCVRSESIRHAEALKASREFSVVEITQGEHESQASGDYDTDYGQYHAP